MKRVPIKRGQDARTAITRRVQEVGYERRGAAAVVTIDRPERRNAVDGLTAQLLGEAYQAFVADDEARVMVLTGAGDVSFLSLIHI